MEKTKKMTAKTIEFLLGKPASLPLSPLSIAWAKEEGGDKMASSSSSSSSHRRQIPPSSPPLLSWERTHH